jgi:hypothetical protein
MVLPKTPTPSVGDDAAETSKQVNQLHFAYEGIGLDDTGFFLGWEQLAEFLVEASVSEEAFCPEGELIREGVKQSLEQKSLKDQQIYSGPLNSDV